MKRTFLIIGVIFLSGWSLWAQSNPVAGNLAQFTVSTSGSFGTAYQNVPYSASAICQGNFVAPCTIAITSGSPPTGISSTFVGTGISGTPTGSGSSPFCIQATDSNISVPKKTPILCTSITVSTLTGLAVTPIGQSIATGTTLQMTTKNVGTTWSNSCTLATCPNIDTLVTWAPTTFGTAGTLGLHTGLLTAGSAAATPSVTAAFNSTTSAGDTVTITSVAPNPVLSTSSLPNGQINQPYPESGSPAGSNQLVCSGGSGGPYTFQLSSGSMPTGFPTFPSTGLITGTSTAAATYTPHFTCTDSGAHVSAAVTINIVIASLSSISALQPAAPTVAQFGQQQFTAPCVYSDSSTASCQPASGGGIITPAGCGTGSNNTTNVATLATSTTCAVSVGDVLAISYYSDNAATPAYTVPTDTAGNTAVVATAQQCVGGASDRCQRTYYMPITIANAADTITGHFGTATHPVAINVVKLSGASASPLDQNGNSNDGGTSSNQSTSASITPTVANTMAVFSTTTNGGGRTYAAGTGCTMQVTDATGFMGTETCPIAGTSATTELMTLNGAADFWIAAISNYKPAAGGSGLVWTATDASGGPNVATITNTGLATANNAGTSNIKACIGATCSANDLMTVTGAADTSITTTCPTNIFVGPNAGSCQAIGNPSNTNDTNTASWSSSTTSVVTVAANGILNGVANGSCPTGCITATVGSLHGSSGAITVSTSSGGGGNLLNGCTVDALNTPSCSIPGGWTLVVADGAEAGAQGNEDLTHVTVCTAGTTTDLGTTMVAHNLSHSYCGKYAGDEQDVDVRVNIPNGTTQMYASWWERLDPQGLYPSSDYVIGQAYGNGNGSIIGTQAQTFNGNGSFLSTTHYPHTYQTNNNEFFWYSGPTPQLNPALNAGVWVQYEELIIPDTIDGTRLAAQQTPPSSCPTPTTAFCGNGVLKLWQNGTLVLDLENAQLTYNSSFFTNAIMHIGDFLTSFSNTSTITSGPDAGRCKVWSSTGGGTCPGTQPGTGGPKPFYRYYDDIIILRQ